jgi:hypothetical protein
MSRSEPFCNRSVAARRVLSPFAGLRRGDLTYSTLEIGRVGGCRCAVRTRSSAVAYVERNAVELARACDRRPRVVIVGE